MQLLNLTSKQTKQAAQPQVTLPGIWLHGLGKSNLEAHASKNCLLSPLSVQLRTRHLWP